jgi:DNA-binding GntR family transcriptional regulator
MKKVNSDVAYDYIRKKIISGEYAPGSPLMTETLSGEIRVSRTPVREALYKLKGEGLVSISPRLGASVKKMDVKEFRETCELRLALEGHSAGLAALNHSQGDLREIRFALEAMRELTASIIADTDESKFIEDLVREDVRFHVAIMTAAHNDLMKSEILRLNMVNRLMIGPKNIKQPERTKAESDENRRRVQASHEEIYETIARGDSRAAREAMERHIQDIVEKTLHLISESGRSKSRQLSEEELAYSG